MTAAADRGAGAIAIALFAEIAAAAAPDEAAGLLAALGTRIADAHPVTPAATVGDLETQLATHFAALGWGGCTLTPTYHSLDITHRGAPRPVAAADWEAAFPALLAAVYARWFALLGAPPGLLVSVVAVEGDVVRLRQG
ncbi:MAG: hypothetical protein PGN09_10720 [Sphingomonas fennica]